MDWYYEPLALLSIQSGVPITQPFFSHAAAEHHGTLPNFTKQQTEALRQYSRGISDTSQAQRRTCHRMKQGLVEVPNLGDF